MSKYEDFKKKHLHYLAKVAALGQPIGRDKKLLDVIKVFIAELQAFLNEDRKKIGAKEAAELTVWRDHWINVTKPYK